MGTQATETIETEAAATTETVETKTTDLGITDEIIKPDDVIEKTEAEKAAEVLYADDKTDDTIKDDAKEDDSKDAEKKEEAEAATGDKDEAEKSDPESKEEAIEYKLALKEETFLSDEDLKSTEAFAKEHGISNEGAQEILSRQDLAIANYINAESKAQTELTDGWANMVRADAVLGGDNLASTVENAKQALTAYGNDELRQELNETGYGNHPELVRFLSKIGAAMANDTLHMGSTHGANVATEDLFYANKKQ